MSDSAENSKKAAVHLNNSRDQKQWIEVKRPPRLIVLENHFDYAAPMLLARLIARLRRLNFTQFYFESFMRFADFEAEIKNSDLETTLKAVAGLDYSSDGTAIMKFLSEAKAPSEMVASILRDKYLSNLFRNLKAEGIEYEPIDSRYCRELEEMHYCHPLRDTMMANTYITAKHNVFGLNGIAHLPGFMQRILDSNVYATEQDAYNDYLFVYPFAAVRDIPTAVLQNSSERPGNFQFMFFDLTKDDLEESCMKILKALSATPKLLNIKQLEIAKNTLEKKLLYEFYALSQEIKKSPKEELEILLAEADLDDEDTESRNASKEVPGRT